VLRAITKLPEMRDRSVVRSSVIPSAKYSCSGSFERFLLRIVREIGEGQDDDRQAPHRFNLGGPGIDGHCGLLLLPHDADKADAPTGHGADQTLRLSTVADRFSHGIDAAGHRRFRDDPAAPDRLQEIVLADDAFAVPNQVDQEVEDLRFERDPLAVPPELAPIDVKQVIGKDKFQFQSPGADRVARVSTNYHANPKEKPIFPQSLRAECAACFISRSL